MDTVARRGRAGRVAAADRGGRAAAGVLDAQLRADAGLTHFEYFVLAMLSEAPERTLRMTSLAQRTNATLPRLSHVVSRLEDAALSSGFPAPRTAAPPTRG